MARPITHVLLPATPPATPPPPQNAPQFMSRTTGLRMHMRLALLQQSNNQAALLFEAPAQGAKRGPSPGAAAAASAATAALQSNLSSLSYLDSLATADVMATQLPLQNTLMAAAIEQQQARFLRDCWTYMQVRIHLQVSGVLKCSGVVEALCVCSAMAGALLQLPSSPCFPHSSSPYSPSSSSSPSWPLTPLPQLRRCRQNRACLALSPVTPIFPQNLHKAHPLTPWPPRFPRAPPVLHQPGWGRLHQSVGAGGLSGGGAADGARHLFRRPLLRC